MALASCQLLLALASYRWHWPVVDLRWPAVQSWPALGLPSRLLEVAEADILHAISFGVGHPFRSEQRGNPQPIFNVCAHVHVRVTLELLQLIGRSKA